MALVAVYALDVARPREIVRGEATTVDLYVEVDGAAPSTLASATLHVYRGQTLIEQPAVTITGAKMTATVAGSSTSDRSIGERVGLSWKFSANGQVWREQENAVVTDMRAPCPLRIQEIKDEYQEFADANNIPSGNTNIAYIVAREWEETRILLDAAAPGRLHAMLREVHRIKPYLRERCCARYAKLLAASVGSADFLTLSRDHETRAAELWIGLRPWFREVSNVAHPEQPSGQTLPASPGIWLGDVGGGDGAPGGI
ncbi:MAG TPA: hypothetical protein VEI97_14650 [bacterium]|nr:hypothetical protein [bacterium]